MAYAAPADAFVVVTPAAPSDATSAASAAYESIAAALSEQPLEIVQERVFGSLNAAEAVLAIRAHALASRGVSADTPLTYVEGRPPWGDGLAGVILRAVRRGCGAGPVRALFDAGRPCGRIWQHADTTHVVLQNITGADAGPSTTAGEQTARAIERADRLLAAAGLSYRDVARTWFYIADIGRSYAAFNRARSAKYRAFALLPDRDDRAAGGGRLPASTGIGGRVPGGPAVSLDLLAVRGSPAAAEPILPLGSPGQKDAYLYGSAFSRAVLLRTPDAALLELSGTAAIDEDGRSMHPNNFRDQVECTLDKVAALLRQCGVGLSEVCAATAFVKHAEDAGCFWDSLRRRGLSEFPAVCVVADICRTDLLFEMDAEVGVPGDEPECTRPRTQRVRQGLNPDWREQ